DHGVLPDRELNATAYDRLKSRLRHMNFVLARLQHRKPVAAARVGLQLPDTAGRGRNHDDVGVGERGTGRVGDDSLEAGTDGLRMERGPKAQAGEDES